MELDQYLHEKFAPRTAHGYKLIIEHYYKHVKYAEQAKYKDVLSYLEKMRNKGRKSATLLSYLAAIKSYYDYLKATKTRKDHPCKYMRLKDKIDHRVNVQDLFTSTELELLLDQPAREMQRQPKIVLRDKSHHELTDLSGPNDKEHY